jgi:hypothetical protein
MRCARSALQRRFAAHVGCLRQRRNQPPALRSGDELDRDAPSGEDVLMTKRASVFALCVALGLIGLAGLAAFVLARGNGTGSPNAARSGVASASSRSASIPAPAAVLPTPGGRRWVGFDAPPAPMDMDPIARLQEQIGAHVDVVSFFIADGEGFPEERCERIAANGSVPLVTLEFWSVGNGGVSQIVDGSEDEYLRGFGRDAKAFGGEIWLRPFHEMNGDVYPWGSGANSPGEVVAAFRHVHDVFASQGASNVKFVWCPNVDIDPRAYYPGDAYVDYAALDGYNNGEPWRSFSDVFGSSYQTLTRLTSRPIFIAETSCAEGDSGQKATWIAEMFNDIRSKYTRVAGVVWFNEDKSYDWRVDTSDSSLSAFSAGVAKGF